MRRATAEFLVLAILLILSVLGLLFMNTLVAPPKLLFGRALSALAPSLFPTIILTALALLCLLLLLLLHVSAAGADEYDAIQARLASGWNSWNTRSVMSHSPSPLQTARTPSGRRQGSPPRTMSRWYFKGSFVEGRRRR